MEVVSFHDVSVFLHIEVLLKLVTGNELLKGIKRDKLEDPTAQSCSTV